MCSTERTWTVYVHKNKFNGKVYVGITCQSLSRRWVNGKGYRKGTHFYNAIQRYGWDAFAHIVVKDGLSREDACKKEIELIEVFNSTDRKFGYNMTFGGEANIPTEATRAKISNAYIDKRHPFFGRHLTPEQRSRISNALMGRFKGKDSPCYGRVVSMETRQKMSDSHRDVSGANNPRWGKGATIAGKNNPKAKSVVNVTTGITFNTVMDAAIHYGVSRPHISSCCRGNRHTCGGFVWQYAQSVN